MPTYTLELKLHTKRESDLRYLENYFREVARLSNTVRRFAIRQLELLSRDPAYKTLLAEYRQLEKGKEKTEETEKSKAHGILFLRWEPNPCRPQQSTK